MMTNTNDLLEKYGQAVRILPPRLRSFALNLSENDRLNAEEFRLRAGREFAVSVSGREKIIAQTGVVRSEELDTVLELATKSSVHTARSSIREGFVTVEGGHRVGLCGTVVRDGVYISGMRNLSSVSIRIAKCVKTAADGIFENVFENDMFVNTLIVSPPGCGKTTTLRELIRRLSNEGYRISLVDERGEIAAKNRGIPQFDVGKSTDVLDGTEKSDGAILMLRSMSPDIIAVDEITAEHDINAMKMISNCGVGIIATAHGESKESIMARPLYKELFGLGIFRVIIILNRCSGVFSHRIERI